MTAGPQSAVTPREVTPHIGGRAQPADRWTEVRDPYRGELAATVAVSDAARVDEAVRTARRAQATMAAMPAHERAAILRRAADIVEGRVDELAETITRETGKIIRDTRREAARAPWTLRASATAAETITGDFLNPGAIPSGGGLMAVAVREPVGVVAAVTPFNAPLNLVAHKVAPAIAAGNAIVVKPASPAPIPALDLALILEEAGLPPGVVNIVPGNASTGQALVTHPDVDLITFTGGPEAGEAIRRSAGFRKALLELGGNSPNLVHDDAHLPSAVDACLRGGFANGGQSCNSVQRILVQERVVDTFVAQLVAAAAALRVGDPLDPDTQVGPVVSEASAERVIERVEEAIAAGGTVVHGGTREGALIQPTVVVDAPVDCRLYAQEIFAPVVLVNRYSDLEEGITQANATGYGLQAAVFTSSLDVAMRATRGIRAGGVLVNRSSNFRLDQLPYGGVKDSGMGREGPAFAVEEMTELKTIVFAPSEAGASWDEGTT